MSQPPTSIQTGNTPDLATALADLPPRVRVHDLARRAGLNSKQAIAALTEAGVEVGSASSSVDREVAEELLTRLLGAPAPAVDAPLFEDGSAARPTRRTRAGGSAGDADAGDDASRPRRRGRGRGRSTAADAESDGAAAADPQAAGGDPGGDAAGAPENADAEDTAGEKADGSRSRRRRRGGRGRRGSGKNQAKDEDQATNADLAEDGEDSGSGRGAASGGDGSGRRAAESGGTAEPDADAESDAGDSEDGENDKNETDTNETDKDRSASRRRRRRRRRSGSGDNGGDDDPADTVVHVREGRSAGSDSSATVQGVKGSTRLEAKRQRRRDSRDSRRRPQILSEAEFLARRESVDRVMAVRQRGDLAQVALLEDGILVEHFVSRKGSASMIGNVYLGRVQNVLPSMEAAFVDIGKGRNAVLYAGEVNWDIAGLEGKQRRIEMALSSGDNVLVQVSKDPVGHKGARLTTQISLPGRFLVYVPGGGATGISRKLPDKERKRLKGILDRIVPKGAGVIIRTAAEGVGEEELAGDVARLKAQWDEITASTAAAEKLSGKSSGVPTQLYAEPDTLIKVIRDLFNSDINRLLVDGDEAWASVSEYVLGVAPELADRVSRYVGDKDVFAAFRVDEQITKALQRKVHLPSGGSLVIDRTEAMTVIDVNTGKFTGSGGNLEETVTRNNIEAAEEIVRQLRLRDIGGIIVVDFIDMVLESNRELVLRRLTECLGRDRTRHQVAEVTSLGLVQMTRKRMGLGLVEAFSEPCPHCGGRGILLHDTPADTGAIESEGAGGSDRAARKGRKRGRHSGDDGAKYEPLIVERVTPDAKPDPRGPKPPAVFRSASAEQADEAVTEPPADSGAETPASTAAEPSAESAPRATEQPARAPATENAEAVTMSSTERVANESTEVADAPAKPARRRRAAGRPAGAPETTTAVVDIVLPAPAAHSGDATTANTAGDGGTDDEPVTAKPRRRRAATRAAGPVKG